MEEIYSPDLKRRLGEGSPRMGVPPLPLPTAQEVDDCLDNPKSHAVIDSAHRDT
jgi:hypothetical protein